MNKLTLDDAISDIRRNYDENPELTEKMLSEFTKELNSSVKNKKSANFFIQHSKEISIFLVVIELMITMLLCFNGEESMLYAFFGLIFFAAGIGIGFSVKGFGLIFLFSHGMTGFGFMLAGFLSNANTAVLSDLSSKGKTYLAGMVVLGLFTILTSVAYNLSDKLKKKDYNKNIVLGLYLLFVLLLRLVLSKLGIVPFVLY